MTSNRNEPPIERAPCLLVFGDLSGRVAALVRARPSLIARLIVAPREAIHSIGAFLHLAPEAAQSDAAVAAAIGERHPRDLLRAALPDCPPRLYRALDRAGDRVQTKRFYERLAAVCVGPFADALLSSGAIDDARLSHYEAMSRMDPALAGLHISFVGNTYLAEAVDCLVALLRSHGALRDSDLRLPPKAGMPALARRLRTALGRIEAPDPGFAAPAPFRLVRTAVELQRIGRALGNCVALPDWSASRHHVSLVQGSAVFLVSDEPQVLASLNRVADGVWYLEQLAGLKNKAPPPGMRATLIRDLTAAGQRVVSAEPSSALDRLTQEGRRRRDPAPDDLDEFGDDEEGDEFDGIAA